MEMYEKKIQQVILKTDEFFQSLMINMLNCADVRARDTELHVVTTFGLPQEPSTHIQHRSSLLLSYKVITQTILDHNYDENCWNV